MQSRSDRRALRADGPLASVGRPIDTGWKVTFTRRPPSMQGGLAPGEAVVVVSVDPTTKTITLEPGSPPLTHDLP